jgi:hypothetical protein
VKFGNGRLNSKTHVSIARENGNKLRTLLYQTNRKDDKKPESKKRGLLFRAFFLFFPAILQHYCFLLCLPSLLLLPALPACCLLRRMQRRRQQSVRRKNPNGFLTRLRLRRRRPCHQLPHRMLLALCSRQNSKKGLNNKRCDGGGGEGH